MRKDVDQLRDAPEALHQALKRGGYYSSVLPKVEVAEKIAPHLDLTPGANRSHSFNVFLRSLNDFIDAARAEA